MAKGEKLDNIEFEKTFYLEMYQIKVDPTGILKDK